MSSQIRSGSIAPKSLSSQRNFKAKTKYCDDYNYNKVCGIINLGNNCYLNSGLQILASCEELTNLLDTYEKYGYNNGIVSLLKIAFDTLLSDDQKTYEPSRFINSFCSKNYDFIKGSQCCSQNFIRTLIRNINDCYLSNKKIEKIFSNEEYKPSYEEEKEYNKFISSNKIFPESKAISIFSGMTKSHSNGKCPNCYRKIDNYSFSYFIDQNIYLDEFQTECEFKDVLEANLGNNNILTMDCPKCKEEIEIEEKTKIIKLPEILIFTLERYQGPTNTVKIKPNKTLEMGNYIDKSLKTRETSYELFAINIRFGRSVNFGHEICQVKRGGRWYEINDRSGNLINNISRFDCSYGLFYKKIKGPEIDSFKKCDKIININPMNEEKNIEHDNNKKEKGIDYLNCALEIIASFDKFNDHLNKINKKDFSKNSKIIKTKNIIHKILTKQNLVPTELEELKINSSIKINPPQDFIRNLISTINDELITAYSKSPKSLVYENENYKINKNTTDREYMGYMNYIKDKNIYPQSLIYPIFTIMTRKYFYGKCIGCHKKIYKNIYDNKIDFPINLDLVEDDNCKFSDLLKLNFDNQKKEKTSVQCDRCFKYNKLDASTMKIIKLPEILIFTLNRIANGKIKKKKIEPDTPIELKNFIDVNLEAQSSKYNLFAISIHSDLRYACKVKRNGIWNVIGDEVNEESFNDSSLGLFYRICYA